MANALYWLRDKIPNGQVRMGGINNMADSLWKSYLNESKQSDNIYMELIIANDD